VCVDSSSCVQKGPDRIRPSQKRYRPRLRSRDKANGRGHAILRLNAPWNRCAVAGSVSRRMPSKRGASERLVERALDALSRALTESGAPWMVIGGIAVIARGVRRFTTDIDAAVRGDAIRPAKLLEVFRKHGIVPRIPDALSFADANLVRELIGGSELELTTSSPPCTRRYGTPSPRSGSRRRSCMERGIRSDSRRSER